MTICEPHDWRWRVGWLRLTWILECARCGYRHPSVLRALASILWRGTAS